MPAVLAYILGASVLAGIARFLVSAVGVGIVTYIGFDLLLAELYSLVGSSLAGVPSDVLGLAGLAGVDTAFNLVLSGASIRISLIALSRFVAK